MTVMTFQQLREGVNELICILKKQEAATTKGTHQDMTTSAVALTQLKLLLNDINAARVCISMACIYICLFAPSGLSRTGD